MPNGFWFVYGGTAAVLVASCALTVFMGWLNLEVAEALAVEPSVSDPYVFVGVLAVAMAALIYALLRFSERTD